MRKAILILFIIFFCSSINAQDKISESLITSLDLFESQLADSLRTGDVYLIDSLTEDYKDIAKPSKIFILDKDGYVLSEGKHSNLSGTRLKHIPSQHYDFWNMSFVTYDSKEFIFKPVIESDQLLGFIVVNFQDNLDEETYEELYLRLESLRVTKLVDGFLLDHPTYNLSDLADDPDFWEIGIQDIDGIGYTAIAVSDPFRILIHPYAKLVGQGEKFFSQNASRLWGIIEPTLQTRCEDASGTYDWKDETGNELEKYIFFSCANVETADNITLAIAATASLDELSEIIEITRYDERSGSEYILENIVQEHDKKFERYILNVVSFSKAPIVMDALSDSKNRSRDELFDMWSDPESRVYEDGVAIGDDNRQNDLRPSASEYLSDLQVLFEISELFVVDNRGYVVASSGTTSDFDQSISDWKLLENGSFSSGNSSENWFEEGINSDIYISEVEYDKSAGVWGIDVVVRITKDGEILGLLKAVLNYNSFISKVIEYEKNNFEILIINSAGYLVGSSDQRYDHTNLSSDFESLLSQIELQDSGLIEYDGRNMFFLRSDSIISHYIILVSKSDRYSETYTSLETKEKALQVAKQIESYLISNPELTVKDLQNDEVFSDIAVQRFGDSGYTAVSEMGSSITRFHPNRELIDTGLNDLEDELPKFWEIVSKSNEGEEFGDVYDWVEPDGSLRRKYMYIANVDVKTADGVGFRVAATSYLDDPNSDEVEFSYFYLLTGLFCLAGFILFFLSKTNDVKIRGINFHYKSLLVLGILALLFHILYILTDNITIGLFAIRGVIISLMFFVLQVSIINMKVTGINITRKMIISLYVIISMFGALTLFTNQVVIRTIPNSTAYGNFMAQYGGFFNIIAIVILLTYLIPFVLQLFYLRREDYKIFGLIYLGIFVLVGFNVIFYVFLQFRNPFIVLISPALIIIIIGMGLTSRKIIKQEKNAVMFTLAVSLFLIVIMFIMNTVNITNNLKLSEIENAIEQKTILVGHAVLDIENDLNLIRDTIEITKKDYRLRDAETRAKIALKEMFGSLPSSVKHIYLLDGDGGQISQYPDGGQRPDVDMLNGKRYFITSVNDKPLVTMFFPSDGNNLVVDLSLSQLANERLFNLENTVLLIGNVSYDGNGNNIFEESKVVSDVRLGLNGSFTSGKTDKRLFIYDTFEFEDDNWGVVYTSSYPEIYESISGPINRIWIFTISTIIIIIVIGGIFNSVLTKSLRKEVDAKTLELTSMVTELTDTKAAVMNMMEDITKANEELKELDQAKSNFLNMVSHELKTPLTAMNAHLEVLGDMDDNLKKQQLRSFDAIRRNSNQLRILIENILEIARIESNKFHLNLIELDLGAIINDVVENLSIIAKNKEVDMDADVEKLDNIIADEARIKEILNNLVSNAIKFTEKGKITISAKEQDKDILVSVRDSGIGIPDEKMGNLFQKFYQVDASLSRRYGGTGLGLSITKQLVELQGGKIWVKSKPGKGSEFFFTLPLKKSNS